VEWPTFTSPASIAVPLGPAGSARHLSALAVGPDTPTRRVQLVVRQFHFHTHSEHTLAGAFLPIEAHLVATVVPDAALGCGDGKTTDAACYVVFGTVFSLADDDRDNEMLAPIFDRMPLGEGWINYLAGDFNLSRLLPANSSYLAYSGSLTTPPCNETLLWNVMLAPLAVSVRQYYQFLQAVGDNTCHAASAGEMGNLTAILAGKGDTSQDPFGFNRRLQQARTARVAARPRTRRSPMRRLAHACCAHDMKRVAECSCQCRCRRRIR
jgi:hypothetical protein